VTGSRSSIQAGGSVQEPSAVGLCVFVYARFNEGIETSVRIMRPILQDKAMVTGDFGKNSTSDGQSETESGLEAT
jgi:hypothetical protein